MKKVFLKGPFLTQSGYGHHARTVLRALQSRQDIFDIYLHPLSWGATSWLWQDSEERREVDSLLEKTIAYTSQCQGNPQFDISVQVTIPNEWEKLAPVNIGVTAGVETTRIAPKWIEQSFLMDKILTISEHSKNTFVDTVYQATKKDTGQQVEFRCSTPVEVIHYPVREFEPQDLDIDLDSDFNFLTVAQLSPRKNAEQLIRCFVETFRENENVGLIIKANLAKNSLIDRKNTVHRFKHLLSQYGDRKCKIYLLHGFLTDNEMSGLYTHPKVKAIVSTTHGEGFGLPLFEAAYHGLPVIATDWSGHLDFLYKSHKQKNGKIKKKHMFSRLSFTMQQIEEEAAWENVLMADSQWAFPEEGSIKMSLEEVHKDHGRFVKRAKELQKWIKQEFTEDKINNQYSEHIYGHAVEKVSLEDIPKISIVTSVYDGDEFIEPFLEDITRQSIFKDKCELIMINANSPGNEEEVILKYKEKYPDNIVYKKLDEDPGIYAVWNLGVEMSTGEFITNANLDDRKAPNQLERLAVELFSDQDVDLVYSDMLITDKPNETFESNSSNGKKYNFPEFSFENLKMVNMPHSSPLWRKSVHEEYGFFDDQYRSAGDWEMWLRAASKGSRFKKVTDILGLYYFNPNGISTNPDNFSWKHEEERKIYGMYKSLK